MSTEPPVPQCFADPAASASAMRMLREMLDEILTPSAPFTPTPRSNFALDGSHGLPLDALLGEVRDAVVSRSVHLRHPWTMGHMVPPPLNVSVVADLLIGALNQCAFIWEEAPAAADLERAVLEWLGERLGYGPQAVGMLTSGGTESNRLAMFLALDRAGQRVRDARQRACIIATDQAHVSLEKAATLLGLDPDAVIRIPTNETGRLARGLLDVAAHDALAEGRLPVAFVCTAGTTNSGAIEPIEEFLTASTEHNAWCHVDAAHGGFVRLLPTPPPGTDRWASAHSVSWDAHKTLHASYAVGALLLRDAPTTDALGFTADYTTSAGSSSCPELERFDGSRRMEALKLWMCIKHLGVAGYAQLATRCRWLAEELAELVQAHPDLALVTPPDTNVVCFRYEPADPYPGAYEQAMLAAQRSLFAGGGPLLSCTRIGGRVTLRAVLLNPATTREDLDAAVTRTTAAAARATATITSMPSAMLDEARV